MREWQLTRLILFFSVVSAGFYAGRNLYFALNPYFYEEYVESVEEAKLDGELPVDTVALSEGQFVTRYVGYAIVGVVLTLGGACATKEENLKLLRIYAGTACCCSFYSFSLFFTYLGQCTYDPDKCTVLRFFTLVTMVTFALVAAFSIHLFQKNQEQDINLQTSHSFTSTPVYSTPLGAHTHSSHSSSSNTEQESDTPTPPDQRQTQVALD